MNTEIEFFRNKIIDKLTTRDKVNLMETEMNKFPLADDNNGFGRAELRVENHFSLGVYARSLYIPADTIVVGKIHKYENLNILAQGDISVLVDNEIVRIRAPFVVVSPPGTKRIAYAHEDTVWITIHGTELRNVEEIEKHFIAQSEQEFLEFCGQISLLLDK
jgi:hypothetical protein